MNENTNNKYLEYFASKIEKLNETLQAASKTPYGKNVINKTNITNYKEFTELPILENSKLIDSELFLQGDTTNLIERTTGGTTGSIKKKIYYTKEAMASWLPPHVTDIINTHKAALLHKHWEITSYIVMDETMKKQCPNVDIKPYKTSEEALSIIKEYEVVYITEQVSKMAELLYDFDNICKNDPSILKEIKGKYVFIEIGAEPVSVEELSKWYEISKRLFQTQPDIVVIYGTNQTLLLGITPVFELDTKVLKYRVVPHKLVEILDPITNEIVIGKEGKVIVTPLKDSDYPGSVFIRFDTEDLATMEFGEDGNMYLSNIHRNESAGMISLYGLKFFAGEFYNDVVKNLEFPIKIQYKKIAETNSITLYMKLYSPKFLDKVLVDTTIEKINELLMKSYYRIKEENSEGKINIKIETDTKDPEELQKGWQILK